MSIASRYCKVNTRTRSLEFNLPQKASKIAPIAVEALGTLYVLEDKYTRLLNSYRELRTAAIGLEKETAEYQEEILKLDAELAELQLH